jgi:hypothetical protein
MIYNNVHLLWHTEHTLHVITRYNVRKNDCLRRYIYLSRVRVGVKYVCEIPREFLSINRLKDEVFFNSEVKTSSIEQRNEGMTVAARVPFIVEVRKRAMVEFDDG